MANDHCEVRIGVENEDEDFTRQLEMAKALSLETLELDRIRREQRFCTTSSTSFNIESNASSERKGVLSNNKVVIKSDEFETNNSRYNRPRPGSNLASLQPVLPPPPRRQLSLTSTSSVTSGGSGNSSPVVCTVAIPDLMTFSSPESKNVKAKHEEPEFDPLLSKTDLGAIVPYTAAKVQTPNFSVHFPNSSLQTAANIVPNLPPPTLPFTIQGPLPLNHWNFPPPFSLNNLPSTAANTNFSARPYSSFNSKMSVQSTNVFKTIEKKQNGNLIDLSMFDRFWLSNDDMKKDTLDNLDLLQSFDPLSSSKEKNPFDEKQSMVQKESQNIHTALTVNLEPVKKEKDNESNKVEVRRPERLQSQRSESYKIRRNKVYESVKIFSDKQRSNSEIKCFKDQLVRLRRGFSCDDRLTNVGLVISPTLDSLHEGTISVKLAIYSIYTDKPICFACDITTSIEHVISQFICSIYDDISNINLNHYSLKIHGKSEYVSFDSSLVDYEYVYCCHKFDEVVRLTALDSERLERSLARSIEDDETDIHLNEEKLLPSPENTLSEKSILILMETLEKEITKLKQDANSGNARSLQGKGVMQSVKLICAKMAQIETRDLRTAIDELHELIHYYYSTPIDSKELSTKSETGYMAELTSRSITDSLTLLPSTAFVRLQLLNIVSEKIIISVQQLIDTYCRCFQVYFPLPDLHPPSHSIKDVTGYKDTLLVYVSSVHRIPVQWSSNYESFVVSCEVYHGTRLLTDTVETCSSKITTKFYKFINFEQWIEFKGLMLCILPKEARLCCTLSGISMVISDGVSNEVKTALCWATLPLFNYNGELSQGRQFCGMWSADVDQRLGPAVSNISSQHCSIMEFDLPDFGCTVLFPPVLRDHPQNQSQKKDFELLDSRTQQELLDLVEKSSPTGDVIEDREKLWQKRRYLYEIPQALPKVLLAAHSWDWSCLSDIYQMLSEWKPMSGVDALELLLPCFPDCEVRRIAISWIRSMSSDELCDYLSQLVQALKYETYDISALAEFLIERALTSIRVMHHLYWLLKQNIDDRLCSRRMMLMLNSLFSLAGKAMRDHLSRQEDLISKLSRAATKVKDSKDSLRLPTLLRELDCVNGDLQERFACLPLSPSFDVFGLDMKGCNYFTSKTIPLRLSFHSGEVGSAPIEAIFKIGDDLRQDMLTLQMIRIMDKLWLKEGLNLQIITFACIATSYQQGVVEMVSGAETLGRIQKEHGLTGPFKDHPIAEWLQKYNTTEREYLQAVDNFTSSCAGYSVATYILGICDRHNDNIMVKSTGHLFHIDFGKFLGDSETFGGLKRDRVPFVLTSDMAFVINGGDKPSDKFQHFVDLCCQAFNVIRKHGNLFLNLFALMVSAGIPGVTIEAVNYIQKALLPELSECEAAIAFTRMIQDSLKSWFTQFNFFIHNLAQLKFSSEHSSDLLLSFVPRTYTMETDGKIHSVDVVGYQKRYEPEKYYVYLLRVERDGHTEKAYLLRSYREFCEFHHKLCTSFPLAKYMNLPKVYLGRSNVRHVAEKRKVEIESFLISLWKMADEIKHCDLVYTFLHPLLRDLHEENDKRARESMTIATHEGLITGSVKLSIHYKNDTLFVMVLHAKSLSEVKNQSPDTYVKTYLVPDPNKTTKRKTKMVYRNSHPTYMEMMTYRLGIETVQHRILQVSVWHHGIMSENTFLGAVGIELKRLDLKKQTTDWYQLGNVEKLLQR